MLNLEIGLHTIYTSVVSYESIPHDHVLLGRANGRVGIMAVCVRMRQGKRRFYFPNGLVVSEQVGDPTLGESLWCARNDIEAGPSATQGLLCC